jgi:hypothetical protein
VKKIKDMFECLDDCEKISDLNDLIIEGGEMSYCMSVEKLHFFILVEDDKEGKRFAFSYVPHNVFGYLPFLTLGSAVIDTHTITYRFLRLKKKKIKNWKYVRNEDGFRLYNILTSFPLFNTSNCIGYSNYHYKNS